MDLASDSRELWEATLRDDALEHQVAVFRGRGREDRPDVSDGLLVGGAKAAWRILRCNPWTDGGYDPVDPEDRERHEREVAALEAESRAPSTPSQ